MMKNHKKMNKDYLDSILPDETFGVGIVRFDFVFYRDTKYKKIMVFANSLENAIEKINLRFDLVISKEIVFNNVYKLKLMNKMEGYLYESTNIRYN